MKNNKRHKLPLALIVLSVVVSVLVTLPGGGVASADWAAPAALNSNAATDTETDEFPQVTADGAGNWVAVWHSNENLGGAIGTDFDILVARSTDNGATWTAPAALSSNAATDTGTDTLPQVTTDGAGNWVAVWQSNENLSGAIGTDNDILYATETRLASRWPRTSATTAPARSP